MPTTETVPDTLADREPDTVYTPEGDNENTPHAPLKPPYSDIQIPRGGRPMDYYADHF